MVRKTHPTAIIGEKAIWEEFYSRARGFGFSPSHLRGVRSGNA